MMILQWKGKSAVGTGLSKAFVAGKRDKKCCHVARQDVREFLDLAAEIPIIPEFQEFALEDANQALMELKNRKIRGAKVLLVE